MDENEAKLDDKSLEMLVHIAALIVREYLDSQAVGEEKEDNHEPEADSPRV